MKLIGMAEEITKGIIALTSSAGMTTNPLAKDRLYGCKQDMGDDSLGLK